MYLVIYVKKHRFYILFIFCLITFYNKNTLNGFGGAYLKLDYLETMARGKGGWFKEGLT